MPRIALDAMGGDLAPATNVSGALLALSEFAGAHTIQLVGREEVIRSELAHQLEGTFRGLEHEARRLEVIHARDVIEMSDKPSVAVRGIETPSLANESRAVIISVDPREYPRAVVTTANGAARQNRKMAGRK